MSAAPGCHCGHKLTVSSFLKHPCNNNRFIRQQQARLASTQCGSPRLSNSKFATGTAFHNTPSNGHRCSAFFKFGKSNEYKGDGEGGGQNRQSYSAEDVEYYFNYSGILAERGSYDTMENLIEAGIEPVDILLLLASSEGDTPKVVELLAAGANSNIKDLDGKTPTDLAKTAEVKEALQSPQTANA